MIKIREVIDKDLESLLILDKHVNKEILKKKIRDKEIIVLLQDNEIIGWLRYSFFWDEHPFMNMLFIIDEYRAKGYGTKLTLYWEKLMLERGYKTLMLSTQSNEYSQHFYRKLGYTDVGSFSMHNEPLELILIKELSK